MWNKLPDRFWDKVQFEPNTGCWLWIGASNPGGYGRFFQPPDSVQQIAEKCKPEKCKPDTRRLQARSKEDG